MPLYLTGTRSSRVTKPKPLQRSTSLPFASTKHTNTLQRAQTLAAGLCYDGDGNDDENKHLAGPGTTVAVLENDVVTDVLSAISYARTSMFDALPERAGMNSVRIAQVLNFQKNLPAIVSLAHIHALRSSLSKTERDIQNLLSTNRIRRIKLVGRGNEVSGLGEVLISTKDYEGLVCSSALTDDVLQSFLAALQSHPRSHYLPASSMPRSHIAVLTKAGFLTIPSVQDVCKSSSSRTSQSIVAPATVSRSASGSQAAVGGEAAFETLGGVNGARRSKSDAGYGHHSNEYVLSVPGIAAYLQLLDSGRNHLLELLRQSSKHKQAPMYLLKERWNGNVDNDSQVSVAKQIRGEFSNVLPAKTKKWRVLNGLSFDWVVEECLGAGLIEVFETYSVGLGVRALV
ncbi:hypothetical protein H2198_004471 [Neophaeococcomyces mojaviensis]|uniref:Uncharacterized protein n=1 Tax=Neophaeococcomyces mojaviensis TaxID=3383035 RepID=A0ACC3A8U3_9EURO|nr:hypothetical protein H2198_004471 [Knufia sp. JES_112]